MTCHSLEILAREGKKEATTIVLQTNLTRLPLIFHCSCQHACMHTHTCTLSLALSNIHTHTCVYMHINTGLQIFFWSLYFL